MVKKNQLTKEEILHLAELAKLKLTEQEIIKFQKQLQETVDYIDNLNELPTEKVTESSQNHDLINCFFKDGATNERQLKRNETLANVPNKNSQYFVVKRIL